jgi:hypothetical protein
MSLEADHLSLGQHREPDGHTYVRTNIWTDREVGHDRLPYEHFIGQ